MLFGGRDGNFQKLGPTHFGSLMLGLGTVMAPVGMFT